MDHEPTDPNAVAPADPVVTPQSAPPGKREAQPKAPWRERLWWGPWLISFLALGPAYRGNCAQQRAVELQEERNAPPVPRCGRFEFKVPMQLWDTGVFLNRRCEHVKFAYGAYRSGGVRELQVAFSDNEDAGWRAACQYRCEPDPDTASHREMASSCPFLGPAVVDCSNSKAISIQANYEPPAKPDTSMREVPAPF